MNIIQDIYTKNIVSTSTENFQIGANTAWGEVIMIESKETFDITWVKTNLQNYQSQGLGTFLNYLETVIVDRKNNPTDQSYTASLFKKGINKIAQKVGEEAVEVVIEAKDNDKNLFLNETSDLLFHVLVLIVAKEYTLDEVIGILKARH
jgi:phosphoribosyl-ATP pyrophosphohydrolase